MIFGVLPPDTMQQALERAAQEANEAGARSCKNAEDGSFDGGVAG